MVRGVKRHIYCNKKHWGNIRNSIFHTKLASESSSENSVTVPAGTFDTYLVEETTAHDGVEDIWRQYWYVSDTVNNFVKHEHYNPHADELYFEGDLTSYDVAVQGDGKANGQEDDFSFLLFPVGLAVLIIVLVFTVFLYYRQT